MMHVVATPATGEVFMNSPATQGRRGRKAQRFGTREPQGLKPVRGVPRSRLNRPRKKSLVYALRFSNCCFFELIGLFSRCFGLPSAVLALSADTTAPALHRGNQFH